MSVNHSGWQSRIDWWSSGCEDEIETYKIKEYEKQIKSDNVGGGSAAVAAVEFKCAGFQNRQMRRQHRTLDDIVKI